MNRDMTKTTLKSEARISQYVKAWAHDYDTGERTRFMLRFTLTTEEAKEATRRFLVIR